jgi:hypothetical protein
LFSRLTKTVWSLQHDTNYQKKLLVMTTQAYNRQQDVVKDLRKIRDQISNEIKDMSFEEERVYLDKLLADKGKSVRNKQPGKCLADGSK